MAFLQAGEHREAGFVLQHKLQITAKIQLSEILYATLNIIISIKKQGCKVHTDQTTDQQGILCLTQLLFSSDSKSSGNLTISS